ncbi:hypothetical protein [Noviherbaspirillum sp.]|uniref:hypothetical protein n=1 Tax=Noviherbaspirillum sp. TaxID=1926288 RepID=UPI002D5F9792|nr:hypothetical protein [Noviherbaspirillum sp.]HZW20242.1 hypothetical protein [Noviherbaspirillum sp.]
MKAKIVLSDERDEYTVADIIGMLAAVSAAHAAETDHAQLITKPAPPAPEMTASKFDDETASAIARRPPLFLVEQERYWTNRVCIGISKGTLIARTGAGHPSQTMDQFLDLFVTRNDLTNWLRSEHYIVEIAPQERRLSWKVRSSRRADALTPMIEAALWAAHRAGKEHPPSAREVMDWINDNKPENFLRLTRKHGLHRIEYLNNNGSEDGADIDAIDQRLRRAIERA